MNLLARLLNCIDGRLTDGIDLRLAQAGIPEPRITSSVSPLPVRSLDIRVFACCECCVRWTPADCPIRHTSPCDRPECQPGGAA